MTQMQCYKSDNIEILNMFAKVFYNKVVGILINWNKTLFNTILKQITHIEHEEE